MRERGRRDERKGWSGNNAAVRYLQLRLRTALAQPPLPTSALPIGSLWEQMPEFGYSSSVSTGALRQCSLSVDLDRLELCKPILYM